MSIRIALSLHDRIAALLPSGPFLRLKMRLLDDGWEVGVSLWDAYRFDLHVQASSPCPRCRTLGRFPVPFTRGPWEYRVILRCNGCEHVEVA